MSKPINNYFELKKVCRTAGLWYVGSFMLDFLFKREEWENPETKDQFIQYMHREYGSDGDISGTRTRVNAIIRIVESGMVEDAMNMVLMADESKLGCLESKENAKAVLDLIKSGRVNY